MSTKTPLSIVMDYFNRWTSASFDQAELLLHNNLKISVPINEYPTKQDFMNAVQFTHSMTKGIRLLSSFENRNEVMLVYQMSLVGLEDLIIAERFIVEQDKISQIMQIHDTAPFRK